MDKITKYMLWTLVILFVAGMGVQVVSAVPSSQQYSKIYMSPLYRQSMSSNTWYDYNLTIDTPDGISKVDTAMITMQLWLNPTVNFDLEVEGQLCNTVSYQVHTTYANAGEGTIFFDCSNIITGEGDYSVRIRPSKKTGASTFWIDLTYENNPPGTAEVFGTEYIYPVDEDAKMWVQLLRNNQSDFIDSAICHLNIYSPDNTKYLDTATMNYVDEGIYVYDLLVPSTAGVYPSAVECFYDAGQLSKNATNFQLITGTVTSGFYTDTWVVDKTEHKVREKKIGGQSYLEIVYNYSGLTQPLPNLTLGISYFWNGRWPSTGAGFDFVTISWWNWTDSSWNPMPNIIIPQSGAFTVSNTFLHSGGNLTKLGYLSSTGEARVKFNDTLLPDTSNTLFQTDALKVVFEVAGVGVYQQVKGAGEIHVINGTRLLSDNITVTASVNNTAVANAVWNYNETINPNLLNQFASVIWSYVNRVLTFFDYETQSDYVWNSTTRGLTEVVNTSVNSTEIAGAVWNDTISSARYVHGIQYS